MSEPEAEEIGVLELGMTVAVVLPEGQGVGIIHINLEDPAGHFRLRQGEDLMTAYTAEEQRIQVDGDAVPWEWAVLRGTGLEVKLLSAPAGLGFLAQGVTDGPTRVAVRPRIQRERG